MQKISDIYIQNIKNLPIWVIQVICKELQDELTRKFNNFTELIQTEDLFQYIQPKLTLKGKQELSTKQARLTDGYYTFMQDISNGSNIFEITVKNNWSLSDTAKIFIKLEELEFVNHTGPASEKNRALLMFIASKIRTGEFLKKIGKIDIIQLEQAIRFQKKLNEEGRHIKMASILIKMGFITDTGLDSLLLLKDEAKKRLPIEIGYNSIKFENKEEEESQITRLQKELTRLENENIIMKKRLKKLLNIED